MGRALPRFELECSDSVVSRALLSEYHADIARRYPDWDPAKAASAEPAEVAPPDGAWLVAWMGSTPIGCGGIKRLDAETAEVKRVFLREKVRGRGLGRALLDALAEQAQALGYRTLRLTTGNRQPEAAALFTSVGFREIAAYNGDPFAHYWLEKRL